MRSRSGLAAGVFCDPMFADQTGTAARAELTRGETSAASRLMASAAVVDRQFYAEGLGKVAEAKQALDGWVTREGSADARLVRGSWQVEYAWRERGIAPATSHRRVERFRARLDIAQTDLFAAAEQSPSDPTPWSLLIVTAYGLGLSVDERRNRWNEVATRYPHHPDAARSMVLALSRKWGGSHDAMFGHAGEVSAAAPDGHPIHAVIAWAHVERWLAISLLGEDGDQTRYFQRDDVQGELRKAFWRYAPAAPGETSRAAQPADMNVIAFCRCRMGDWRAAKQDFANLAGRASRLPWAYQGDPVERFTWNRDAAGHRG